MNKTVEEKLQAFLKKKRIQKRLFTSDIIVYLNELYPNLQLLEQWFLYSHGLKVPPICEYPNCEKTALFNTNKKIYACGCCIDHCRKSSMLKRYGIENPMQIEEIKIKYKNTCLDRYGVENISSLSHIKNKKKQTCLKRFGEITNLKTEDTKNKIKKTNLKRYGYENVSLNTDVKEKKKKKSFEKYGVSCVFKSPIIKKQIIDTCLKRYGVVHPMKTRFIKNKLKNSYLKRYGVTNPMQSESIKNKYRNTCFNRYGCFHYNESHVNHIENYNNKQFIEYNFIKNYVFDYILFCNFFNVSTSTAFKKIRELGIETIKNKYSVLEYSFREFISNYIFVIANDRTILNGKELDIYIPEKKIAIEINGDYWHSESNGIKYNYHINKTKGCEEKNIKLIHIFENELINKRNIVEYFILSVLEIYNNIIDINTYQPVFVPVDVAITFFNNNHIEGFESSDLNIGIINSNEYISIISFREISIGEWEIVRYCDKLGTLALNSLKILLNFFIKVKKPNIIKIYLNRRFHTEEQYIELGFKKINEFGPKKIYLTQHKIELDCCNLTESYHTTWDCGCILYEWREKVL